ncbi:zinc dependent phospholipase C family protein [Spirosoma aerophilum]
MNNDLKQRTKSWLFPMAMLLVAPALLAWGTFGHEHINRAAVMALPDSLQTFFFNHVDFITQESTVPDLRKYTLNDKAENPRHYIDIENFKPQPEQLLTLADAQKAYDANFLQQNGILPWYIADVMDKLTRAFREQRKTEILFLAADLAHYIGDAHMPLHTSANHDGQLTGQRGIHALWESRIPELFGENYNLHTGPARYIPDVRAETWHIIGQTHALVDTLLSTERAVRRAFAANQIYQTDSSGALAKNRFNQTFFSVDYARQYHTRLNGMVEQQMRAAAQATSNYWYTAWVNAGRPDLSKLDPSALTRRNRKALKQEKRLWATGKLFGITADKEY